MNRFKLYICERDLLELAHGNMDKITWYSRKPKQCSDSYCALDSILDVYIEVTNPNKDGKNKGSRKKLVSSRKKRKAPPKTIR